MNPRLVYPLREFYRGLRMVTLADSIEALLLITAHEIAHLERFDRFVKDLNESGRRDVGGELDTERMARRVFRDFCKDRDKILKAWGNPGSGAPLPSSLRPSKIHRLTCRRCGESWDYERSPKNHFKRTCPNCFSTWAEAVRAGEYLVYERIKESAS